MKIRRRIRIFGIFFFFLWSLFLLYPNPANLGVSVYRLFYPPVNPYAEGIGEILENSFASNPVELEEFIKKEFPYFYDWHTYNMPWYFPTTEEALFQRQGDCKTRAIIISSAFELSGIPHTVMVSPSHVWVAYEERTVEASNEREGMALMSLTEGRLNTSFPRIVRWESYPRSFVRAFWSPMPTEKKMSFFLGIAMSFFLVFLPQKTERLLLKKDSFI